MSKTTLGFILCGMVYLMIGIIVGVVFVVAPETRVLATVHAHLNLVGFVMFLIFGIAYHILPRFRGRPLHSESMAWWQFLLANAGLVGFMVVTGVAAYRPLEDWKAWQGAFGALLALSTAIFVYNMMRTLYVPKKEEVA